MQWCDTLNPSLAVAVDAASPDAFGYVARTRSQEDKKQWVVFPSTIAHGDIHVLHATSSATTPQWIRLEGSLPKGSVKVGDKVLVRDSVTRALGALSSGELAEKVGHVDVLQSSVCEDDTAAGGGSLTDVFALDNPRNFITGLWSGAKNVAVGVAGGVAVMVAGSVSGAKEDGVRGALKGTAVGVASGTVLAVCGCVTGAAQIARGIKNTPNACSQFVKNSKVWDDSVGEWCEYNLTEEAVALSECTTEQSIIEEARKRKQTAPPKGGKDRATTSDSSLYELLGVRPDARASEIKQAYMRLALQHHPDRHGSTAGQDVTEQTALFQRINEAYHVLNDPAQRARYDRGGLEALSQGMDAPQVYVSEIVNKILGTDVFKDFIGVLVALHFLDGVTFNPHEYRMLCRTREVRLALKLVFFTMHGIPAELAERLVQTPLGREMVYLIGSAYVACSDRFLAKDRVNVFEQVKNDASSLRDYMISTAHAVSSTASVIYTCARKKIPQEDMLSTGAKFVDLIWHMASQDILDAIGKAADIAFYDVALSPSERVGRAQKLAEVGQLLMSCGHPYEWGMDRAELLSAL